MAIINNAAMNVSFKNVGSYLYDVLGVVKLIETEKNDGWERGWELVFHEVRLSVWEDKFLREVVVTAAQGECT